MADIKIEGGRSTKLIITVPSMSIVWDNIQLRRVLAQAGTAMVARATSLLGLSGTGKRYSASKTYPAGVASAPGAPPARRTGHLQSSFQSRVSPGGLMVTVADMSHYALYLESGAIGGGFAPKGRTSSHNMRRSHRKGIKGKPVTKRDMAARPFLSRAVDELWPQYEPLIEAAALAGLRKNQ